MARHGVRVVLVGRYPPPWGGNTVHVARLTDHLGADGVEVIVLDAYAHRVHRVRPSPPRIEASHPLRPLAFATTMAETSPGSLVHLHMSSGGRFYRAAPVLLGVTRRARRRVLTIHTGEWVDDFRRLRSWERALVAGILRSFDAVVCVNAAQGDVVRSLGAAEVVVIPAYLPPTDTADGELPPPVASLRDRVDALVVTSGYGDPIYGYETLIEALERAQERLSLRLGLACATYSRWSDAYWPSVLARLAQSPVPNVVTRDLAPAEFLRVLGAGKMYVRATRTDGDAVALREAGAAGLQVLASDVVRRPPGTLLFEGASASALADAIVRAAQDPTAGRLSPEDQAGNYARILDVYRLGRVEGQR